LHGSMKVLSQLYKLKYLEGIQNKTVLAEELGLSETEFARVEQELDERLKAKIHEITPERLEFVCPECLNARVYTNPETGERVCTYCGRVIEESLDYDESLPFDVTYALTSELACGRSLGGTLNGKALLKVLAKSPTTKTLAKTEQGPDLGLRARLIRVMAETSEHPALAKALKYSYEVSKRFNMESNKLFNNDLGRNVRRAFWLCWMLETPFSRKTLVETCFWFTLCQYGKDFATKEILKKVRVNMRLLTMLIKLEGFLSELKREALTPKSIQLAVEVLNS
jgi:ribosomal protein S27E